MQLNLLILPETFAVCRLVPKAPVPSWAYEGPLVSVTRTAEELSIVCEQARVPKGVKCEPGWRCFKIPGPLEFGLTGVLASLVQPLAEAGISLFAVSTFDTDYVLVKADKLDAAIQALTATGHVIL